MGRMRPAPEPSWSTIKILPVAETGWSVELRLRHHTYGNKFVPERELVVRDDLDEIDERISVKDGLNAEALLQAHVEHVRGRLLKRMIHELEREIARRRREIETAEQNALAAATITNWGAF